MLNFGCYLYRENVLPTCWKKGYLYSKLINVKIVNVTFVERGVDVVYLSDTYLTTLSIAQLYCRMVG
jgi:hypothetical protein